MTAEATSVTVLTEKLLGSTTGLGIANRLFPVLREMHGLFGAPPRGDSLDVLAVFRSQPIRNNLSLMSGNSEEGAFLCLATPDRYRDPDQLTILATHECLHFYLGGAITASPEPPYRNAPELVWLMEGVTEFLTFHLLERAGIISGAEQRRVVARKEKEYLSTRGWSAYTLADAARRMDRMEVYGLVYSKGFLVGRMLEERMREACGPDAFEGALRQLFEEYNAYRGGEAVTPEIVREVFETRCPGTGSWIDRYALGNERLPLAKETAERVSD
jgi:predicted metalloprotease with PDZ domain